MTHEYLTGGRCPLHPLSGVPCLHCGGNAPTTINSGAGTVWDVARPAAESLLARVRHERDTFWNYADARRNPRSMYHLLDDVVAALERRS